jgi:hypothetical protein
MAAATTAHTATMRLMFAEELCLPRWTSVLLVSLEISMTARTPRDAKGRSMRGRQENSRRNMVHIARTKGWRRAAGAARILAGSHAAGLRDAAQTGHTGTERLFACLSSAHPVWRPA